MSAKPFFIVGAPRSGTTLLRFVLDSHPDVAIPPETYFVTDALDLRGSVKATAEGLHELIVNHSCWSDFHINSDRLLCCLREITPFSIEEGVREFYRQYALRFKKKLWGDKTPIYACSMLLLSAAFPEANFVHIIRDGRDASLSLRDQWFSPGREIGVLAKNWTTHVRSARTSGSFIPGRYFEIRYEELISDFEEVMNNLCQNLGLAFHGSMMEYWRRVPFRINEHEERKNKDGIVFLTKEKRMSHSLLTLKPPQLDRIGIWRNRMTPEELFEYRQHAGGLLAELGYD